MKILNFYFWHFCQIEYTPHQNRKFPQKFLILSIFAILAKCPFLTQNWAPDSSHELGLDTLPIKSQIWSRTWFQPGPKMDIFWSGQLISWPRDQVLGPGSSPGWRAVVLALHTTVHLVHFCTNYRAARRSCRKRARRPSGVEFGQKLGFEGLWIAEIYDFAQEGRSLRQTLPKLVLSDKITFGPFWPEKCIPGALKALSDRPKMTPILTKIAIPAQKTSGARFFLVKARLKSIWQSTGAFFRNRQISAKSKYALPLIF